MWNRHTIIEKIKVAADRFGSNNPQQLKQLTLICEKSPEEEVFFGLLSFFYDESLQDNEFERQQLSGRMLLRISPASALELEGSIYAVAKFWDYSVEELPWYWCRTFGKENVTNCLNDILSDCVEEELVRSIKTMLFWCKRYKNGT